jgi:hypothetical protein
MLSQKISRVDIHPFLFGLFFIISLYFNNVRILPISDIILPLSIVIGVIGIFWIMFKIFLKNRHNSMFILSLFAIVFFSYGHVYLASDGLTIGGIDVDRHRYLLPPFLAILVIGTVLLIKSNTHHKNAVVITNTISLSLVVIVVVNIGIFNLDNNFELNPQSNIDDNASANNVSLPNIYYIIFDAYPGYHSLNLSNYSNGEMYDYFEDNGFYTSENSFSNYRRTHLSIPSALNMDYVHSLANIKNGEYDQHNFHLMGNENKVMSFLKSNGYNIVSFDSGWSFTRDMKYADLQLCGDNQFLDSEFIIMLAKTSMLNPVYVKIFENNKVDMKLCTFKELPHVGSQVQEPYFVFAHVLMPHSPYLFGPNGEILSSNLAMDLDSSKHQPAFLDQVTFVNKNLMDITDQLIDRQNPPVIIIQSDHGSAFLMEDTDSNWNNPDDKMLLERLNNINFIYLPSASSEMIIPDHTPVNTFRIIFNYYFGTDYELLEDKSYIFNGKEFKDVTMRLQNIESLSD